MRGREESEMFESEWVAAVYLQVVKGTMEDSIQRGWVFHDPV